MTTKRITTAAVLKHGKVTQLWHYCEQCGKPARAWSNLCTPCSQREASDVQRLDAALADAVKELRDAYGY